MEVATWLCSGGRQQLEPVFQGTAIDGHHCKLLAAVPALRRGTGRGAYDRAMANTLARFEGFAAKYLDYRAHLCDNESELARSRCRLLNDAVPAADEFELVVKLKTAGTLGLMISPSSSLLPASD